MSPANQIAIAPMRRPVKAVIRPPGSKSITNRALVVASLARGVSRLHGPLEADDTLAMRDGLRAMGIAIDDNDDPWLVHGSRGSLRLPADPIDARLSGTTLRFLGAIAALVDGEVVITGQGRLVDRPIIELVAALESAGVEASAPGGRLPLRVVGRGQVRGGTIKVDPSRSSQFVSALLLLAPMADSAVELVMTAAPVSVPYITSTIEVMRAFGAEVASHPDQFAIAPTRYSSVHFEIEADASAAAYPLVAAAITGGVVAVEGIPASSTQPDTALISILEKMGCGVRRMTQRVDLVGPQQLHAVDVDMNDAPDAVLALAIACLFASGQSRIRNIGNLRLKESDRLAALETELRRVGGIAVVEGDDILISGGELRPTTIRTYDDHRMAMAFALVGLRQRGIIIENPGVVAKTWPRFFEMVASL